MRPHLHPLFLKASFFPLPRFLCLIRAAHDPFIVLEERKQRMDKTWVSRSDSDSFKVSYYLLLLFGVFMKWNWAENQFSQNLCSIYQSRRWNRIIWEWWVRPWDQGGWPCWTPPPPLRSAPQQPEPNHCSHRLHISASALWIWSIFAVKHLIPASALSKPTMLWWIMKADCGWQDGLMGWHSDRAFREQQQHVNQQKEQPAFPEAHAPLPLIQIWVIVLTFLFGCFPTGQKELLFTVLYDSARAELSGIWGSQDFDVGALGFPR